jgi:hypothetical protein
VSDVSEGGAVSVVRKRKDFWIIPIHVLVNEDTVSIENDVQL